MPRRLTPTNYSWGDGTGSGEPVSRVHGQHIVSDTELLELVTLIYEAAEDQSLWPAFLERFAAAIRSEGTALWIGNTQRNNDTQIAAAARVDPVYLREYEQHYATTNI